MLAMTVSTGVPSFPPVLHLIFAKKGTEPGYYTHGEYGICIENVVVREVQTPNKRWRQGLRFEHVYNYDEFLFCTLYSPRLLGTVMICPMERNLIDVSLLSVHERGWWMRIIGR